MSSGLSLLLASLQAVGAELVGFVGADGTEYSAEELKALIEENHGRSNQEKEVDVCDGTGDASNGKGVAD